jgi:hypothetical protein
MTARSQLGPVFRVSGFLASGVRFRENRMSEGGRLLPCDARAPCFWNRLWLGHERQDQVTRIRLESPWRRAKRVELALSGAYIHPVRGATQTTACQDIGQISLRSTRFQVKARRRTGKRHKQSNGQRRHCGFQAHVGRRTLPAGLVCSLRYVDRLRRLEAERLPAHRGFDH